MANKNSHIKHYRKLSMGKGRKIKVGSGYKKEGREEMREDPYTEL